VRIAVASQPQINHNSKQLLQQKSSAFSVMMRIYMIWRLYVVAEKCLDAAMQRAIANGRH
jgi:hypothetical protein